MKIAELKQKGRSLAKRITKLAADSADGVWRTVRGRRIFIGKGESFADALKKSLGKSNSGFKGKTGKEHTPNSFAPKPSGKGTGGPLTSSERKMIDSKAADKQIDTGLNPNDHAESLDIYYSGNRTLVVPSDEYGVPFALDGKKTPSSALIAYKRSIAKK